MSKTVWNAVAIAACAVAAVAALVAQVSGGCTACLETVSGACVPMKCHWTFIAVAMVEGLAAFALLGLALVKCKVGRRWLATLAIAAQVLVAAALYSPLMGLCGDASMHCHVTATYVAVLAAVVVVLAAVLFALADPKRATLPKRGL